MKTRYLTLFFTLIVFLLLGTVLLRMPQFAATSRSNEPIPYIYYYSDLQHAWIVERADGTDSRLLAQGVMPEDYNSIDSVHWSPSGEWLAWTGNEWSIGAVSPQSWLISTDGRQVSHLLDDAQEVFLMEWASDKDWLVVGFQAYDVDPYEIIRLIDVPNQKIIAEIEQHGSSYYDLSRFDRPRTWSEDGNFVYFTFGYFQGYVVSRLDMAGHVENWFFDDRYPLMAFSLERMMRERSEYRDGTSYKEWFITDLGTNEEYIFASMPINEVIELRDYDLLWNNQRTYALVTEKQCDDEATYQCEIMGYYLLDWENRSHYPIPDNYKIPRNDYYPQPTLWSANGRFLVLEDENKSFYLLDSSNREIFEIGLNNLSWYWLNEHELVFSGGEEDLFYQFDGRTRELNEYLLHEGLYTFWGVDWDFELSANGEMIGYFGEDVVVENLSTGEIYSYPPHSAKTDFVTAYQWGENPEWFFSAGNTGTTACCTNSAIMIHNLYESTGRELTLCLEVDTCAGFLPNRVLPHLARGQAESFTPIPTKILLHDKTVTQVAWNSDGSRLVTYSSDYEDGAIVSIWNLQSDRAYLEQSLETDLVRDSIAISWLDDETVSLIGENNNSERKVEEINLTTGERIQEAWQVPIPANFLSPNRRYVLIFSGDNNSIAHLQDTETQTLISENPLEGIWEYSLFYSDYYPDMGLLVGGSWYRRGGLWDVATGEQIAELNWTGYAAVFSPDGRQLAVAGSEFVTIWDMSEYIENR
jgi:WD40 repeat protein